MGRQTTCDVVVLGGGASGLAAAIAAARAGAQVLVLERDVACGLKVLATGNGRCNLSNVRLDPGRYLHRQAARAVMGEAPEADVAALFESLGLLTCEVEGRVYPYALRAESVRDVLLAGATRAGAALCCGCEIVSARYEGGLWRLTVREPERPVRFEGDVRRARRKLAAAPKAVREIAARRVVIAVGGRSESVCELFGLPHLPETPVLCPLSCAPAARSGARGVRLSSLNGLRAQAALTLICGGEPLHREEGEVLFRDYGVSGIAAFNMSRRCQRGDLLELDLFPHMDDERLAALLSAREDALGPFKGDASWLSGMFARPLAQAVSERASGLEEVARLAKHLALVVEGPADATHAQALRGGVPLDALDLSTLSVRPSVAPALHVCGEALDQDADCGGFNLAWAWLSGLRAGSAAARLCAQGGGPEVF